MADCADAQPDQGLHCLLTLIGYCKMYELRSKARMRLHAGQLEDVPAGTQRGCDIPKTLFACWG